MKEQVEKVDTTELALLREVQKFAVKPEELTQLAADYSLITIESGLKVISAARKDLKKRRADITNKGKELRNIFTAVSKGIIIHENDLIEIISPEEERLEKLEEEIEAAKELALQQRLKEEQEEISARVKELETLGAAFNGVQYSLGETTITYSEVKLFTKAEFARTLTFFQEEFEKEQKAKIWEAEQLSLKLDAFSEILYQDGWECLNIALDDSYFVKDDFRISYSELKEMDEETFSNKKNHIELHIVAREEKRLADEKIKADQKAEADRLASIQKEQEAIRLKQEEDQRILDQKQAEINAQLKAIEDQKAEAKKAEEDKIKADQAKKDAEIAEENRKKQGKLTLELEEKRKLEMAPDIDKLLLTIELIKNHTKKFPELSTQKGKAIGINVINLHNKIITYLEDQIKSL